MGSGSLILWISLLLKEPSTSTQKCISSQTTAHSLFILLHSLCTFPALCFQHSVIILEMWMLFYILWFCHFFKKRYFEFEGRENINQIWINLHITFHTWYYSKMQLFEENIPQKASLTLYFHSVRTVMVVNSLKRLLHNILRWHPSRIKTKP